MGRDGDETGDGTCTSEHDVGFRVSKPSEFTVCRVLSLGCRVYGA